VPTKLVCGLLAVLPAALLVACTGSGTNGGATAPATTRTVVHTETTAPSIGPTAPVSTGPTTATRADACPLLPVQQAADAVGMRLERIMLLRSDGKVVGCRFYALQDSPLHNSEHLPGPHQPAIEIETVRYHSADAAHNAFVLIARRGSNPQQATIGSTTGVCFQAEFYARDHGQDWACAYNIGPTVVVVRTVVVSPALNVIEVARAVAQRL
jgi:hypothetical protein